MTIVFWILAMLSGLLFIFTVTVFVASFFFPLSEDSEASEDITDDWPNIDLN